MNRKERRLLEKKLGADFPLDKFLALMGYFSKTMKLDITSFMLFILKRYIPIMFDEYKDLIEEVFEDGETE